MKSPFQNVDVEIEETGSVDGQSSHSHGENDDVLLPMSTSFLHTIPEGSSDLAIPASTSSGGHGHRHGFDQNENPSGIGTFDGNLKGGNHGEVTTSLNPAALDAMNLSNLNNQNSQNNIHDMTMMNLMMRPSSFRSSTRAAVAVTTETSGNGSGNLTTSLDGSNNAVMVMNSDLDLDLEDDTNAHHAHHHVHDQNSSTAMNIHHGHGHGPVGVTAGHGGVTADGIGTATSIAGTAGHGLTSIQQQTNQTHADTNTGRKKRSPSFTNTTASKRKVGIVCSVTLLLVIVVVLILFMIVHNLDDKHNNNKDNNNNTDSQNFNNISQANNNDTNAQPITTDNQDPLSPTNATTSMTGNNNNNSTLFDSNGNGDLLMPNPILNTNFSDTTTTQTLQLPSLAPSAEGTFFQTLPINQPTQSQNQNLDDILNDDDFAIDDDQDTGTPDNESLLVLLDQAILKVYTHFNALTDFSYQVLSDPTSHRYQAREWLLNNDTLLQNNILQSSNTNTDNTNANTNTLSLSQTLDRIAQRYIMALFYFATLQQQHQPQNNTLAAAAAATATTTTTPSTNIQNKNANKQAMFSIHPDIHECYWIQNACGQEGNNLADATSTTNTLTPSNNINTVTAATINSNTPIIYLNVSHAGLKGTLPFELGYLTDLRELCIHGNELQGTVPEMIFTQLQFLYVVDLSKNYFQGQVPTSLWTLPTLRFAYLHGNAFSGTVPQSLPSDPSSDLEEIWLRDNQLTGNIPQWWTDLPNLDVLSASNNSWTGSLPHEWSQAQSLVFLDLSVNRLTGTIPPSLLYSIPSLQFLYLDFNQIAGTLPTTTAIPDFSVSMSRIGNLRMEALWLQNNQLTGTIPKGFAWEYSRLRQLELQGNQFKGVWECVEPGTGDDVWPQLQELSVDCQGTATLQDGTDANPNPSSNVSGVDMSFCDACCIKCFYVV